MKRFHAGGAALAFRFVELRKVNVAASSHIVARGKDLDPRRIIAGKTETTHFKHAIQGKEKA